MARPFPLGKETQVRPGSVGGLLLGGRQDGDEGAPLGLVLEGDGALDLGEQRVVAAHADIAARVVGGAALTYEDVAGRHHLAAIALDPEAAAPRVATVAGAAARFLVCHDLDSFADRPSWRRSR